MLKELTELAPFLEEPTRTYSARQIAKLTNKNHVTLTKKLSESEFLAREAYGPYNGFKLKNTIETRQLRTIFNLQKIWDSKIIETLTAEFEEPTIVLFGSYAKGTQSKNSDIDLAIITNVKKNVTLNKFEKILGHQIQTFIYTKKEIKDLKTQHPELLNNLCNGMVLYGELEVFI